MITNLRREACSGAIEDLAHIVTQHCLADCLTKHSAKADNLVSAVATGVLPEVDRHPPFREMLRSRHKAFLGDWLRATIPKWNEVTYFMMEPVRALLARPYSS